MSDKLSNADFNQQFNKLFKVYISSTKHDIWINQKDYVPLMLGQPSKLPCPSLKFSCV
jgi:hypothetical protein